MRNHLPTPALLTLSLAAMALALPATTSLAGDEPALFRKIQLSDRFYGEGAAVGDFNRDGKLDIVSGPFWYQGPDFQVKHQFVPDEEAQPFDPHKYSENFLTFVHDFNGDGWPDILIIPTPGKAAYWYENPKGAPGPWKKHLAYHNVDNESPELCDLFKNGKPVLLCNSSQTLNAEGKPDPALGAYFGYAQPDYANPDKPWVFHKISAKGKWHKYTHGTGYGDLIGNGKNAILEPEGWWEQPASLDGDPEWVRHDFKFAEGAAQMLVTDVNGDGLNDVITTLQPHKYGLVWWEQVKKPDGSRDFIKHVLTGEKFADSPYGVKYTQMHSLALADMDQDGLTDFVTGKRWWAHGPTGDPESQAPAVLYWWRCVRTPDGKADFRPYKIDDNSGVGTQVTVADLNGDGYPDIIVDNKKGTFVFINQLNKLTKQQIDALKPQPSTQPTAGAAEAK